MKNFYIPNPFASVLFCALAYRANSTWAAELALGFPGIWKQESQIKTLCYTGQ